MQIPYKKQQNRECNYLLQGVPKRKCSIPVLFSLWRNQPQNRQDIMNTLVKYLFCPVQPSIQDKIDVTNKSTEKSVLLSYLSAFFGHFNSKKLDIQNTKYSFKPSRQNRYHPDIWKHFMFRTSHLPFFIPKRPVWLKFQAGRFLRFL